MAKKISIEELDQNMAVQRVINESDICFYDVRQAPFDVYGLYHYREESDFKRMPDAIAETVNSGTKNLNYCTSGGRIRFFTDSQYVAIRAVMPYISLMNHCAMTGSACFDLFIDDPESGISRFHRAFRIALDAKNGYEAIIKFPTARQRYFTINFPTYSFVKDLYVGLQENATVSEGAKYRKAPPIVYYGSSITQGACASRPGNTYQNIICRRLNMDYVNLGFSGSAKGEDTMADYLAGLEMSAFVCDYDHNARNVDHLASTHYRLYEKIREKNPDLPYIMLSRVDFDNAYEENILRRDVVYETYRRARENGDKNVYYIDGASVFRGPYQDLCTTDSCHPNDVGFALMADAICSELERAFTQRFFSE